LESAVTICLLLVITFNRVTLMACFAVVAGIYLFLHGFHLFASKRSLGHIPASAIRDASQGLAAVSGIATGPYTLPGPITGERCYLYQTTVWQQSESGRLKEWKKVAEETLDLPFFVEDATGRLLVEPLGAKLDLHQNFLEEYGLASSLSSRDDVPPRVSAFLVRHGIASYRPTRIEERSIQPDTPIFIAGTITENPGVPLRPFRPGADDAQQDQLPRHGNGSSAESTSAPEIVRLASGPAPSSTIQMTQQGKIAAALTRAGITRPEAWAAAGVPFPSGPSEGVAVEERTQPVAGVAPKVSAKATNGSANGPQNDQTNADPASGFDLTPPLVLMKGANNSPFMISCHSQPEIIIALGWKSVLMVVGGVGLTVLGLYVLLIEQQFLWGR
jgi:hypothetical protein